jgi:hypothetical protein
LIQGLKRTVTNHRNLAANYSRYAVFLKISYEYPKRKSSPGRPTLTAVQSQLSTCQPCDATGNIKILLGSCIVNIPFYFFKVFHFTCLFKTQHVITQTKITYFPIFFTSRMMDWSCSESNNCYITANITS